MTPDSNGKEVYYYVVSNRAPFALGCFGPVTTEAQCRALYPECDGVTVSLTSEHGTDAYDLDCPCFDPATGSNVVGQAKPKFLNALGFDKYVCTDCTAAQEAELVAQYAATQCNKKDAAPSPKPVGDDSTCTDGLAADVMKASGFADCAAVKNSGQCTDEKAKKVCCVTCSGATAPDKDAAPAPKPVEDKPDDDTKDAAPAPGKTGEENKGEGRLPRTIQCTITQKAHSLVSLSTCTCMCAPIHIHSYPHQASHPPPFLTHTTTPPHSLDPALAPTYHFLPSSAAFGISSAQKESPMWATA